VRKKESHRKEIPTSPATSFGTPEEKKGPIKFAGLGETLLKLLLLRKKKEAPAKNTGEVTKKVSRDVSRAYPIQRTIVGGGLV